MIKFFIKRNWIYFLVSFLCLSVFFYGFLDHINFFYTIKRLFTDDLFRQSFFLNQELPELRAIEPTTANILWYVFDLYRSQNFDSMLILSTTWMQVIIVLFSVVGVISFYKIYHSVFSFVYPRTHQRYAHLLVKQILFTAVKLALSVFVAYLLYMFFLAVYAKGEGTAAMSRSLFQDILGSAFYVDQNYLYFILEGAVRFFLMPFVYTAFGIALVLWGLSLKYVIGIPLLYYYGLSALGTVLSRFMPAISVYFTPTAMMSNGDFLFNTWLLLLSNTIPLWIGLGMAEWRRHHVEI